jgi:FkbM family methyltransferase
MPAFKKDDDKLIYEFIKDTAPKDMFMLDVGARTGKWCKTFVTEFPEATFHCFEALPEQYEKCKNRFRKNNNVTIHNFVISNNCNETTFYKDKDRLGWSGLQKHSYMENFEELTLPSKTLDSFQLTPYFVKLDVEGAELLALQGASFTLKTAKVIYFECNEIHTKEYNYTNDQLYNQLRNYGFTVHDKHLNELTKDEFVYRTADARRYEDPKGYESNYIALSNVRT